MWKADTSATRYQPVRLARGFVREDPERFRYGLFSKPEA